MSRKQRILGIENRPNPRNAVHPCQKIGQCILANGTISGPRTLCPEPAEYTSNPSPIAELICLNGILRTQRKHERSAKPNAGFAHACATLEQAMALPKEQATAKHAALQVAREKFESIHHSKQSAEIRLRAGIISGYMDAFEARALGRQLTPEIIQTTYRNMTSLIEEHESLRPAIQARTGGLRTEIEVNAILLSTRDLARFPWPALEREEGSAVHSQNHDSYILQNGTKLPPIQIKRGGERRNYSDYKGMAIVVYGELEEPSYEHFEGSGDDDPYDRYRLYDPDEYGRRIVWGAGMDGGRFIAPSLADALIEDSKGFTTAVNQHLLESTRLQLLAIIDEVPRAGLGVGS